MFKSFVEFVRGVYPQEDFVPLHRPLFVGNEKKYLLDTIDSTFVSSVGEYVNEFEKKICEYTGASHAVSTVNGTAALHTALMIAGVEPGDLVLTQSLTFVATCNAISYTGANSCFVDVSESTLNIDHAKLKEFLTQDFEIRQGHSYHRQTGQKVSALVVMHTFGHPAEMDEIVKICKSHGIIVIEDAAEALGSFYGGRHAGTIADLGIFSFNGNKTITTGGGGCLVTNDEVLAKRAKHLTTTAKVPHPWEFHHDQIGYNYRMPNLNAALGCAQLEVLPRFVEIKRGLAESYNDYFYKNEDSIEFFVEGSGRKSNYWLNAILLPDRITRDQFLQATNDVGVMTRPVWNLMSDLPMFSQSLSDNLDGSRQLLDRLVNIPSSVPYGEFS